MTLFLGACSQEKESKDKIVVVEERDIFYDDQVELATTVDE